MDVYLRSRGLSLWRLSHLVHYSERHSDRLLRSDVAVFDGVTTQFAAGGGRLAWGHALYFRDPKGLDEHTIDGRRALLVEAALFDAAGEVDALAAILRRLVAAPSCPEPWRKKLAEQLREVEREST